MAFVAPLIIGFPLRQSMNTAKPMIVPRMMELSVISRVMPAPEAKSFQRLSLMKVFSKLSFMRAKKPSVSSFSPGTTMKISQV